MDGDYGRSACVCESCTCDSTHTACTSTWFLYWSLYVANLELFLYFSLCGQTVWQISRFPLKICSGPPMEQTLDFWIPRPSIQSHFQINVFGPFCDIKPTSRIIAVTQFGLMVLLRVVSEPIWKIFQSRSMHLLKPCEKVVADKDIFVKLYYTKPCNTIAERTNVGIWARHESCIAKLKIFRFLRSTFWHSVHCHAEAFHALAKPTAFKLTGKEPLLWYRLKSS